MTETALTHDGLARLMAIFASPLGLTVLFAAVVATIAAFLWAGRRGADNKMTAKVDVQPLPTAPPPLLAPEVMRPGVAVQAPTQDNTLRTLLFIILGLVVAFIAIQAFGSLRAPETLRTTDRTGADKTGTEQQAASGGRKANTPADDATGNGAAADAAQTQGTQTQASRPLVSVGSKVAMPTLNEEVRALPGELFPCEEGPVLYENFDWLDTTETEEARRRRVRRMPERIRRVHLTSSTWQFCSKTQAAKVDAVNLVRDDSVVLDPHWAPMSGVVEAVNQPTPFGLEMDRTDLMAAPGATVEDYDVFIAVGMTGEGVGDDARELGAKRAFQSATFILEELRNRRPSADCQSLSTVVAVSVGKYQGGAPAPFVEDVKAIMEAREKEIAAADAETAARLRLLPTPQAVRPVIFGVRYDPRTPLADRDPVALVKSFLARSNGTSIAGIDLGLFETPEILFDHPACAVGDPRRRAALGR